MTLAQFGAGTRFAVIAVLAALLLGVSLLTRIALVAIADLHGAGQQLPAVFALGTAYDLAAAVFALAPLTIWLALVPTRLASSRVHRLLLAGGVTLSAFVVYLTAVAELIFWEEYGSRFNFIAVDYLVYTHEVLGNIWQSFPVGRILAGIAVIAAITAWQICRTVFPGLAVPTPGRHRSIALALAICLPLAVFQGLSSTTKDRFDNDALNELAGNGFFEFAAAARNNEMEYTRLYAAVPDREAFATVRAALASTADAWRSTDPQDPEHLIRGRGPERHLNVILVSIESLGAEYVGAWGDRRGLTPRLDALAADSLVFANTYATGNRTVRGLEALSLALPPTPGQSIVKRPKNKGLFTLGSIFEDKGYESLFLYGGYGYFDNMNAYFSANDYDVFDRQDIAGAKIHHENIWGVADEDLFELVIEKVSAIGTKSPGKPFFAHVMTTSNHRPYTYPAGRIDIPSGSGREGAVKYTDWALGHFIDEARKQPWFDDTVFVITADHGANARGTREIPVDSYRIPVLYYSPKHLPARRIERLMSQIDIAPTLLGLLDFSYRSKFFGHDVLRLPPGAERAFVANYQTLGYLRDGRMVTLQQRRQVGVHADAHAGQARGGITDEALVREAIAWYEAASLTFRRGHYGDEERADPGRPQGQSAGAGGAADHR